MIIDKISIAKFRGFKDLEFELGEFLTVIAGRNGTQKTTLLGVLSQGFTISHKENIMKNEKPLCGGFYKSGFKDKFKLSNKYDIPGDHEWTYFFKDGVFDANEFTLDSIPRSHNKNKGKPNQVLVKSIRFWQKGNRSSGTGYKQLPVIFLSLKRLLPIGEESTIKVDSEMKLSNKEFEFFSKWYDKILINTRRREKIQSGESLKSTNKQTYGINTSYHDWKSISSGQDNLSKILLAVLSFKRLKEKYKDKYKGGILAIDELDATMYPAAQIKLTEFLISMAAKYKIQILCTTHSHHILENVYSTQMDKKRLGQVRIAYLRKMDDKVVVKNSATIDYIKNDLKVALDGAIPKKEIVVFTEDNEASDLTRSLIGTRFASLNYIKLKFLKCTFSCNHLLELAEKQVPSFNYPNSIIVLDGDVNRNPKQMEIVHKHDNILILPTDFSPEVLIAKYLDSKEDSSDLWDEFDDNFDHTYLFRENQVEDLEKDRNIAKTWYKNNKKQFGTNLSRVMKFWKKDHENEYNTFLSEFKELVNNLIIEHKHLN